MIEYFIQFSFLSTAISALATVVLCIGAVIQARYVTELDGMQTIKAQISTCKPPASYSASWPGWWPPAWSEWHVSNITPA